MTENIHRPRWIKTVPYLTGGAAVTVVVGGVFATSDNPIPVLGYIVAGTVALSLMEYLFTGSFFRYI